jgi:hypothetical protein
LVFSPLFLFSFVLSVYRPTASNKPLDLFKLVIVKYQRILKGQSRQTDNIGYPRLRKTKQKRRSVFEWSPLRQLSLIYWQKNGQHNGQRKKGQKDKQRSTKHTHKTKHRVIRTNSVTPEWLAFPAPLLAPIVLLMIKKNVINHARKECRT